MARGVQDARRRGQAHDVGVLPVFAIKNGGEISLAAVRVRGTYHVARTADQRLKSNKSHRSPIAGELTGTYGLAFEAIGFA